MCVISRQKTISDFVKKSDLVVGVETTSVTYSCMLFLHLMFEKETLYLRNYSTD